MTKKVASALTAALLAAGILAAQKPQAADTLLQAAIKIEIVDGNLPAAIEGFRKALDAAKGDRIVSANALYHLGECYRKQGNAEARRTFEQLIRDYADQPVAAQARAKLALLSEASGMQKALSSRLVWEGANMNLGGPSADGRFQAHLDPATGNLLLRDLQSGQTKSLTNEDRVKHGYVEVAVVSPDNKHVAYTWGTGERLDYLHLRIADLHGANARTVFRCGREAAWVIPYEWTPDGKELLVMFNRTGSNATYHIGLISVATGALRPLVEMSWGFERFARVSPDGRFVVFNRQTAEDSPEQDLYTIPIGGGQETPVVRHPADDMMPVWTPDGRGILFASNRRGVFDLWFQPLKDGKPAGDSSLVKPNLGDVELLGMSRSGTLYFRISAGTTDLYVADLDEAAGKVRGTPRRVIEKFAGAKMHLAWSQDGESLAYFLAQPLTRNRPASIVIEKADGSQAREIRTNLRFPYGLDWFPDGRSLFVRARDYRDRDALWEIDLRTGDRKLIVTGPPRDFGFTPPSAAGDGKTVVFGRMIYDRQSGAVRPFMARIGSGPITGVSASPNGARVAYVSVDPEAVNRRDQVAQVCVRPLFEGESRCLTAAADRRGQVLGWSADSRYIYFLGRVSEGRRPLMRIFADGGDPQTLDVSVPADGALRWTRRLFRRIHAAPSLGAGEPADSITHSRRKPAFTARFGIRGTA